MSLSLPYDEKNYYQKVAFLGVLLIILSGFQKYTDKKGNFSDVQFIIESTAPLSEFDPNDLDVKQWQKLGFSEKQVATILHYKELIGGKFISKVQLKKCYAIKAEKFEELSPYILLPETGQETSIDTSKNPSKKLLNLSAKFNPDHTSADSWIQMGFSEKQAEAILKYKKYLGGSFVSKEKFKECFIISEENYRQLEPYLLLPDRHTANSSNHTTKIQYHTFDPNVLDMDGWQSLGFSQNQAKVIINYRNRNLKGSFKSLEDIQKCFVISAEKFEELKPYIKITLPTISTKQEKTDFSKIDLNVITFKQLLEFGLDERSAGSLIGFRRKLGGFVNKQQILETYNIDKELIEKLISICPLNTSEIQKYTLLDAPEEWLKNHPYFKYSADKIIFYRISNPDEKKIWKLLKLKPEYETRMKLYLK
ncbi:helix-hairpin-helix domain-containing protein [Chryseobacterium daecheongense]|uniref:helix-hairpin-helix domain-containing protein n=1 Tax=Chryseobacterium daecheongense TaxID=192389 RepID=UPI001FD64BA1|nr:helix-hairpin-helix domain-containing protein [Chryseobacterium daecheongense]UOU98065.1 helix-hairpin-helix domain-containing protein [Chryseobacterium daecheongense]